ncbi:MAG: transposase [Prevotella sp.]|nr:transposase [Prevotella sp.]
MEKKIFRNERSREWSMQQDKVASMKRRCEYNDYTDRGIYMITIATEGRRPLLGTLTGKAEVTEGAERPNVVLSSLGEKVKECWMNIPRFYPKVEVMKLCIMPDHIHGVLFVHERMEYHLGMVIKGFKAGTHKAARELGVMTATMSLCTKTETMNAGESEKSVQYTATTLPSSNSKKGALWEQGYHDRLLRHEGQLNRMSAYLEDNPRRLLLKRDHPGLFKPLGKIMVAGIPLDAMGNIRLLDAAVKLQVQCSRHLYPQEIEQQKQRFLKEGQEGAVIVSPCISLGERQISSACLENGIPLIVLLLKGFPPFFKPDPRYLMACAEGRLLMLSPYPWQNEQLRNMRARCLELNNIAAKICQ